MIRLETKRSLSCCWKPHSNGLNWFLSSSKITRALVLNAFLHVINSLRYLNLKTVLCFRSSVSVPLIIREMNTFSFHLNYFLQITNFGARFHARTISKITDGCVWQPLDILSSARFHFSFGISLIISQIVTENLTFLTGRLTP